MTRRALPSDPLSVLRDAVDVAPPEGAALRIAARLASGAAGTGLALSAAATSASESSRGWSAFTERFVRWSLLPLGAGIAIGAGGQALLSPAQVRPQPALPVLSAQVVPSTEPAPLSPLSLVPEVIASAAAVPSVAPVAPRSTLADERSLLDRARRQLASDEPARALTFLQQHAQRFARGELTEEREAMYVNVLVRLGRKEEAKTRGAAFQSRFPNSLMGANVRAALRAADVEK